MWIVYVVRYLTLKRMHFYENVNSRQADSTPDQIMFKLFHFVQKTIFDICYQELFSFACELILDIIFGKNLLVLIAKAAFGPAILLKLKVSEHLLWSWISKIPETHGTTLLIAFSIAQSRFLTFLVQNLARIFLNRSSALESC